MKRGEFGEASSSPFFPPCPSSPLRNYSPYFDPHHRSTHDFSFPSYFSNGLSSLDYGSSSQLSSSNHYNSCVPDENNLGHDSSLFERFQRLIIGDEEHTTRCVRSHTLFEPNGSGFPYGVVPSSFGANTSSQFQNPSANSRIQRSLSSEILGSMSSSVDNSLIMDSGFVPSQPVTCEIKGHVYSMAKDQHGCRFLQTILEYGTCLEAITIYNEMIPHVVELMMDPFGNYLMQRLLDLCNEEQRTQIIIKVTEEPRQLIQISLNSYGTRVVQRLVESIKTRMQISLMKSALRHGFLSLIKNSNGNHVIERCLQCLSAEDNEFIFDNAFKFCIDIATHRHGCCVLQQCIAYSTGLQRQKLLTEISRNSVFLAQDPFGNYAVQFVIELRDISAMSIMLANLKGHYVKLSQQKFSSHMVERCLQYCPESVDQIVCELITVSNFDLLIQHPYANFVIQAALDVTKGPLHATLVQVIRPHWILRNHPYCKRIFSKIT